MITVEVQYSNIEESDRADKIAKEIAENLTNIETHVQYIR